MVREGPHSVFGYTRIPNEPTQPSLAVRHLQATCAAEGRIFDLMVSSVVGPEGHPPRRHGDTSLRFAVEWVVEQAGSLNRVRLWVGSRGVLFRPRAGVAVIGSGLSGSRS